MLLVYAHRATQLQRSLGTRSAAGYLRNRGVTLEQALAILVKQRRHLVLIAQPHATTSEFTMHTKTRRATIKAERSAWNRATAVLVHTLPSVIHVTQRGCAPLETGLIANHFGRIPVIHRERRHVQHESCLGTLADAIQS